MTPRRAAILGALIALAATVWALRQGTATINVLNGGRRVQVDPPGWEQTSTTRCIAMPVRLEGPCLKRLRLSSDAGYEYALMRACGEPRWDAGTGLPEIPDCIDRMDEQIQVDQGPPDGGVHALEVWLRPFARHACACRSNVPDAGACGWIPPGSDAGASPVLAPRWRVLPAGTWAGPGCQRVPCGELMGSPLGDEIQECCLGQCVGRDCGEGRCGGDCGRCPSGQVCRSYRCEAP